MEPGNWIALVAVVITAIGSWLTYRIAAKGIDNQRTLADRQVAAEILDATVLELTQVRKKLTGLESSLALAASRSHQEDTRERILDLWKALTEMEVRSQRLGIRFRNDIGKVSLIAENFQFAISVIKVLLAEDEVVRVRKLHSPNRGTVGEAALTTQLEEARAAAAVVVGEQNVTFQNAQDGVADAAFQVVGIDAASWVPLSRLKRFRMKFMASVMTAVEWPFRVMRRR